MTIIEFTHTAPTEIILTPKTGHMRTAWVLFNPDFTSRTSSHISCQSEANECALLNFMAFPSFMPLLLAVKTSKCATVSALDLLLTLSTANNFFLTLDVWAPKHVWVLVYLSRETKPLISLELAFFENTAYFFLCKKPLLANTPDAIHVWIGIKLTFYSSSETFQAAWACMKTTSLYDTWEVFL